MKGLFLYNKLTEKDFNYFKPPKKALEEEKRLKELDLKTLRSYQEGLLIPAQTCKIKELSIDEDLYKGSCSVSERGPEEEEVPTLIEWNKVKRVVEKYKHKYRKDTMERILDTLRCAMDSNSSSTLYTIHDITSAYEFCCEDSKLWAVCNVPGDGNCWIHATIFSQRIIYKDTDFYTSIEPREARQRISDYILSISGMTPQHAEYICRKLDLRRIIESSMWQELSRILNYGSVLEILSKMLSISAPGKCLWAGDLGEELTLLATILNATILVFQRWTEGSSPSCCIDSREFGKLQVCEIHRNIRDTQALSQKGHHCVVPIFYQDYHFQALLPPRLPEGHILDLLSSMCSSLSRRERQL